jgi:hypothetical protein
MKNARRHIFVLHLTERHSDHCGRRRPTPKFTTLYMASIGDIHRKPPRNHQHGIKSQSHIILPKVRSWQYSRRLHNALTLIWSEGFCMSANVHPKFSPQTRRYCASWQLYQFYHCSSDISRQNSIVRHSQVCGTHKLSQLSATL